jgi:hypothetical protein
MSDKREIPNLPKRLFWDWNFDKIDWQGGYLSIIERVIERGNKREWEELMRYYSKSKVLGALKHEITYLPDYAIEDVCSYFEVKKEDLACYARAQLRRGHWI